MFSKNFDYDEPILKYVDVLKKSVSFSYEK